MGISTDKAWNYSIMEIDMKECTRMASPKVVVHMHGATDLSIKASSKMDFALAQEFGSMEPKNMKVPMLMTKETDKEFTHGQEAAIIKEILSRI